MTNATDVVIVGGGPTGLTAAYLLHRHGLKTTIIERRDTPSGHPRAHMVNTRSMELFGIWGIADRVTQEAFPNDRLPFDRMGEMGGISAEERRIVSPALVTSCAQDRVERELLDLLKNETDTTTLWDHEVVGVEDLADRVVTRAMGPEGEVEVAARWVIAADGANSTVREHLGVEMLGEPFLGSLVNVWFDGDIMPEGEHPPLVSGPRNPEIMSAFISMDGKERWCFHVFIDPQKESVDDYPPERCASLIRRAWLADDDVEISVRSVRPWTMTALVAERLRVGSIFLAGDAAHAFPPTGGFGMNSGVQDAHNLAWKLAAVKAGQAGEKLLESYEAERRPVACLYAAQSLSNAMASDQTVNTAPRAHEVVAAATKSVRSASATTEDPKQRAIIEMLEHGAAIGMDIGFAYDESPVIIDDGVERPDTLVHKYISNACPGARAPHMYVSRDGVEVSLLALFEGAFTLLIGPHGSDWHKAVERVDAVDLQLLPVGPGEVYDAPADAMELLYGIKPTGAVLVRPDGHVAYRALGLPADPERELSLAIETALGRR